MACSFPLLVPYSSYQPTHQLGAIRADEQPYSRSQLIKVKRKEKSCIANQVGEREREREGSIIVKSFTPYENGVEWDRVGPGIC